MRGPLALAALLAAACCATADSPEDVPGFGVDETVGARAAPVKSEVKLLQCVVCENLVQSLSGARETLRAKKAEEEAVIEHVEKACNPEAEEGEWIAKLDVVQEPGGTLKLVKQASFGKCQRECSTIARACERVANGKEMEIGEMVFRSVASRKKTTDVAQRLHKLVCRKHCKHPSKRAPSSRKDEAFHAVSEQERSMAKMLRTTPGAQLLKRDGAGPMSAPPAATSQRPGPRHRSWLESLRRGELPAAIDSIPSDILLGTLAVSLLVLIYLLFEIFDGDSSEGDGAAASQEPTGGTRQAELASQATEGSKKDA